MTPELVEGVAWKSAAAGALALAFGGAPLGVLLIARRMSLIGDAMSHGILPGAAIAYLLAGPDPIALTLGALTAGFVVAGLSSLLAQTRRLPEDASFCNWLLKYVQHVRREHNVKNQNHHRLSKRHFGEA